MILACLEKEHKKNPALQGSPPAAGCSCNIFPMKQKHPPEYSGEHYHCDEMIRSDMALILP